MIFNKKYLIASALFLQSLSYATQDLSIDNTTATAQMEGIEQLVNLTATYEKKTNPNNTTFCSFQLTQDSATKVASFIESKYETHQDEFTANQKTKFTEAIKNKHIVGTNNPFHISIKSENVSNIKDEYIKNLTEKLTFSLISTKPFGSFFAAAVEINHGDLQEEEQNILKAITKGLSPHLSLVRMSTEDNSRKSKIHGEGRFLKELGVKTATEIENIIDTAKPTIASYNLDEKKLGDGTIEVVNKIIGIFNGENNENKNEIEKQINNYLTTNGTNKELIEKKQEYMNKNYQITLDTLQLCIFENFFFTIDLKHEDLCPLFMERDISSLKVLSGAGDYAKKSNYVPASEVTSNKPIALLNQLLIGFFKPKIKEHESNPQFKIEEVEDYRKKINKLFE